MIRQAEIIMVVKNRLDSEMVINHIIGGIGKLVVSLGNALSKVKLVICLMIVGLKGPILGNPEDKGDSSRMIQIGEPSSSLRVCFLTSPFYVYPYI